MTSVKTQYNLRPRKRRPCKKRISIPQPGDRVCIFWESLNKAYDGTLLTLDQKHKTFLVEYDDTPHGYDDNRIWEDLDYVPWKFTGRFRDGLQAEREKRLSGDRGAAEHWESFHYGWIQPGELSEDHPQFCKLQNGCWLQRQRRRRRITVIYTERGDLNATDEDEEHASDEDADAAEDQNELRRSFSGFMDNSDSPARESAEATSADIENTHTNVKRRKYANFGALGFYDDSPHLSGAQQSNVIVNAAESREHDTIRIDQRAGSNKTAQNDDGIAVSGYYSQRALRYNTGENPLHSPSLEEQIRTITRSFGLSNVSNDVTGND